MGVGYGGSGVGYYTKLEESGWLRHVRLIMCASVLAAEKLHLEGASVLVHCSDGWDRTGQVCSLTQLILDPYYRTLEGLAVLIEKDWCAFGYKFQDRCGHGMDYTHLPDERSPIFLQFLDTLLQLLHQFPDAFQFTPHLLLFLADHEHSSLFGTFLGNSMRHRMAELRVVDRTPSIWSYIMEHQRDRGFLNRTFRPHHGPVWPSCTMAKMVLWDRYFNRWSPEAHPHCLATTQEGAVGTGEGAGASSGWHDDWGAGFETA